jgi:hydroxymethylpyrimidine/phosphomethylpyrimidine kinase
MPSVIALGYSLGMASRPVVLSIAGYDPSSGAGITADTKTAAALGCYAVTCVSALTVQSTQGVFRVEPVQPEVVQETLTRLADDVEFAAVRIGMLGSGEIAKVVARFLRESGARNVVLDPVLRSSSGASLIDAAGFEAIRNELLPLCDVITPNFHEAIALAEADSEGVSASNLYGKSLQDVRRLAAKLQELGCQAVVITGGHLPEANDYLSSKTAAGTSEQIFRGSHIESKATHGTGCAFAMALACGLANGLTLVETVGNAKEFVRKAVLAAYPVGKGIGPMNHLFRLNGDK